MIKKFEKFNDPEVKIDYYSNGQKRYEEWYLNDKRHREDGPAIQRWYESGQKKYEEWALNGYLYRDDGPTFQEWYENGEKYREAWTLKGKYHRENGPTYQKWDNIGKKVEEEWWLNNKKYTREEWVKQLKKINSPYYEEQKILLDIEKYNI